MVPTGTSVRTGNSEYNSLGKVVELRFFGGLSIEETSEVLRVSLGTVMRDWTLAKAWLRREISGSESQ